MVMQTKEKQALAFEQTVKASPAETFRMFTNTAALRDWLCNASQVDGRKGGRIFLWWNDGYNTSGTFTKFEKNQSLAFTWRGPDEPSPSTVQVNFEPTANGTTVKVEHSLSTSDDTASALKRIWDEGLENLQFLMENGIDLRLARRPMFGLSDGDVLSAERAAALGVPVKEGIWLGGLVEGFGAQKAGFQRDDVIVGIGGMDVANWAGFIAAIEPHHAGDRVRVDFYRGAEPRSVEMELSKRPEPNVPATKQELANRVRTTYATLDADIEQAFAGATEEQADFRRTQDGWNAKEVVAHLVALEQDNQACIAAMSEDGDIENIYRSNGNERLRSIVSVYSSVPLMIEALKGNEAVTAAMIENMPDAAAGRKHMFNQLGAWMTTFDNHTQEHIREIKSLLDEARG